MLLVCAYQLRDSFTLLRAGVSTEGRVAEIVLEPGGRRRHPVAYVALHGAASGRCRMEVGDLVVGQTLAMRALPDGSVCRIDTFAAMWGWPAGGFALGSVLALLGLTQLAARSKREGDDQTRPRQPSSPAS